MFGQLFSRGTNRNKIAVNTAAQLLGKFFGAGTTFVVSLVIANQFGATGFGDFVKITTFVSLFFLIADFGLNATYVQRKDAQALSTLLGLRIVSSVALMFGALAVLSFLPQSTTQGYTAIVRFGIILFVPSILFQSLITSANAVFQKHLRYEASTVAIICGSIVTLGVLALGWYTHAASGAILGVASLLMGSIAAAVVSLWLASSMTPLSLSFSFRELSSMLLLTIPLGITLISNVVYAHADSFILTLTRPTAEVGTYGLAYKVFEVLLVFPTFFMNVMYPLLLDAVGQREKFVSLIKKSSALLVVSSIVMAVCVWIFAPYLTWIKSDFMPSVLYLRVLVLSLPIFYVSSLTMWILITLKQRWLLAVLYVVSMVMNVALNIWLTPQYGALASAWITVVCEACILVCSFAIIVFRLSKPQRA